MDQSAINVRYAKAFFAAAKDKKKTDLFRNDIQLVLEVCNSSSDFIMLLDSPVVKTSKKARLIESIFKGKVDQLSLDFLLLITQNKREAHLPGICRYFIDLIRREQNIRSAVLTTATEVSAESVKKIQTLLEKELKASVELSTQVKPDILGGLVLRLDDQQYDASVASQLKKIKQSLLETEL